MTTAERRAYMAEYMRAYRTTHKTAFSIYERARNKLRKLKLSTQEQETAKRVRTTLQEIANYLVARDVPMDWHFAIGYARELVTPLTREPQGEGFGNLKPPKEGEGK